MNLILREFSIATRREQTGLANRRLQPLGHLSGLPL
jgi:hypothetical protein